MIAKHLRSTIKLATRRQQPVLPTPPSGDAGGGNDDNNMAGGADGDRKMNSIDFEKEVHARHQFFGRWANDRRLHATLNNARICLHKLKKQSIAKHHRKNKPKLSPEQQRQRAAA